MICLDSGAVGNAVDLTWQDTTSFCQNYCQNLRVCFVRGVIVPMESSMECLFVKY